MGICWGLDSCRKRNVSRLIFRDSCRFLSYFEWPSLKVIVYESIVPEAEFWGGFLERSLSSLGSSPFSLSLLTSSSEPSINMSSGSCPSLLIALLVEVTVSLGGLIIELPHDICEESRVFDAVCYFQLFPNWGVYQRFSSQSQFPEGLQSFVW